MKSLEARFCKVAERNQLLSSYAIFAIAVKGQNFDEVVLHKHFNRLVDKDDYEVADKKILLEELDTLTKRC